MANLVIDQETSKFLLAQEIEGAGTVRTLLETENNFLDKDIIVATTTPAGALGSGTGSTQVTSNVALLGTPDSSAPASGPYIKAEFGANVAVQTSGWLEAGTDVDVNVADVYVPVEEATFTESGASVVTTHAGFVANNTTVGTIGNAVQTITGGGLTAGAGNASATSDGLSDGSDLDATSKITLSETNAANYYRITVSGYGTVARGAVTKQVTTAGYSPADADPVTAIAADSQTSNTATKYYYIQQSSLSASSVTPATTAQTVTINPGYYHEARTITVNAMTTATPTTSLDNTGLSTYFNEATQSSHDVSITPQYSNTAGYVAAHTDTNNGGIEYYDIKTQTVSETNTTIDNNVVTRGTRTESAGWKATQEVLPVATLSTTADASTTYVNLSGTSAAPVLVSGGNIYISEGWIDNIMISTAHLVPDGTDVKGHANYILYGHTALDEDGTVVTGNIPTYTGSYTVL